MKKTFIKTVALLTLLLLLATSCSKTGATGPAGPAGNNSVLTGNLQGVVFLFDAGGEKILSPTLQAGDTVILTNNSTGTVNITTTNMTGTYIFNNIPAGTYSITVTKSGYGIVKAYGFEFAGGGTTYRNFSLQQIPVINVTTIQATTSTISVNVNGTLPASVENVSLVMYISLPGNTSVNSTSGNFSNYTTLNLGSSSTSFNFNNQLTPSVLHNLGFVSGSTVYIAVYVVGTSGSFYSDPITGLIDFTALSSVPATAFATVP